MYLYLFITFLLIVIAYLLSMMPRTTHKHSELLHSTFYAHRGLHDDPSILPENSLPAFRLAIKKGYGIEMDVQLTKDKVPVVFHDSSLKRVCGVDKLVSQSTYNELKELTLHSSKETIPLFQEVLELVKGQVPLIVELKSFTANMDLCRIVAPHLDHYSNNYCIESFNPLVLLWFRKNRTQVIRGQLCSNLMKESRYCKHQLLFFLLQNLQFNIWTRPDFIAYNHLYRHSLPLMLFKKLYRCRTFAWTIDSKFSLEKCQKQFDCYIFERFSPTKPS